MNPGGDPQKRVALSFKVFFADSSSFDLNKQVIDFVLGEDGGIVKYPVFVSSSEDSLARDGVPLEVVRPKGR